MGSGKFQSFWRLALLKSASYDPLFVVYFVFLQFLLFCSQIKTMLKFYHNRIRKVLHPNFNSLIPIRKSCLRLKLHFIINFELMLMICYIVDIYFSWPSSGTLLEPENLIGTFSCNLIWLYMFVLQAHRHSSALL